MRCNRARRAAAILGLWCTAAAAVRADPSPPADAGSSAARPTLSGFQATAVGQAAPRLRSPYAGENSLLGGQAGLSGTVTLFLGIRAFDGLDLYLEPEAATGSAPGQGAGLAGGGNGDLLGQAGRLDLYLARAFVRWRIGLGGAGAPGVRIGRDRQLVEATVPARRLVFTVGRLAATDLLDQNAYAGSARTQFLNLAFVNDLAYDFPQDQHGYSQGVLVSAVTPSLSARAATFLAPSEPGGALSWSPGRSRGDAAELTWTPAWPGAGAHRAAVRLVGWRNTGRMGRYADALQAAAGAAPSLEAMRQPGAVRWGVSLNGELPLADDGATGVFARAGLAGGSVEALSFAEADGAVSAGVQVAGARWGRGDDVVGAAAGAALASAAHRAYLAAGGVGLRLGDGSLRYGPEIEAEVYYACAVTRALALTADLQGILDPGFNRDRGPVALFSLRVHVEL